MQEILLSHGNSHFEAPVAPVFVLSEAVAGLGKVLRKSIYVALLATAACETAGADDPTAVTTSRCPPGQTDPNPQTPDLVYCVPDAELAKCYEGTDDSIRSKYSIADGVLSTGPINLLVVPVYELQVDKTPTTHNGDTYTDDLRGIYFDKPNSAANFFRANSDSNVDIQGSVYGHPLGMRTHCYGKFGQVFFDDLLKAAKEIPGSEAFNAYQFVLIGRDKPLFCGYSTLGSSPKDSAHPGLGIGVINGDDPLCLESGAAHELGHSLGLRHASSYGLAAPQCPTDLPLDITDHLGGECIDVYGDDTTMGDIYAHGVHLALDASQRRRLGAKVPHETVTAPGTFSLNSRTIASHKTIGSEQLVIPTSDGYFSLEYNSGHGVEIRFVPDHMPHYSGTDTLRIQNQNLNQNQNPFFEGDLFQTGSTWTDVGRGIFVTFGAMADSKATIVVNSFKH